MEYQVALRNTRKPSGIPRSFMEYQDAPLNINTPMLHGIPRSFYEIARFTEYQGALWNTMKLYEIQGSFIPNNKRSFGIPRSFYGIQRSFRGMPRGFHGIRYADRQVVVPLLGSKRDWFRCKSYAYYTIYQSTDTFWAPSVGVCPLHILSKFRCHISLSRVIGASIIVLTCS